eukprot:3416100-Amphidinium_carterae.1
MALALSMRPRICLPSVMAKLAIIPPLSSIMHTRPMSVLDSGRCSKGSSSWAPAVCLLVAFPTSNHSCGTLFPRGRRSASLLLHSCPWGHQQDAHKVSLRP